jgi:hypothetical protein
MIRRTVVTALFAGALAAVPLAAVPQTEHHVVTITRSAGTCPKSIAVTVVIKRYDAGALFDYTAQTMVPAYSAQLLSATPQRIVFDAELRPAYASCEGAGKSGETSFTLHKGTLTYVLAPGKGPNNTYPGLIDVGVAKGLPHVNMAVTD